MPEWINVDLIAIIFNFYGTDWLAMLFTMLQLHLLGCKKLNGFKFGIIGNFFWMIFAIQVGSIANMLANCIFMCINLKGLHAWQRAQARSIDATEN